MHSAWDPRWPPFYSSLLKYLIMKLIYIGNRFRACLDPLALKLAAKINTSESKQTY